MKIQMQLFTQNPFQYFNNLVVIIFGNACIYLCVLAIIMLEVKIIKDTTIFHGHSLAKFGMKPRQSAKKPSVLIVCLGKTTQLDTLFLEHNFTFPMLGFLCCAEWDQCQHVRGGRFLVNPRSYNCRRMADFAECSENQIWQIKQY